MLIVLEGPDWAGKSTLASDTRHRLNVSDARPLQLMRKGPPKLNPLDEYVRPLLDYRPLMRNVICDRWHVGELIYPHVLGRTTKLDTQTYTYIEWFLTSRGMSLTVLLPELNELYRRSLGRPDDLITLGMLPAIRHGYATLTTMHTRVTTPDQVIARAVGAELLAAPLSRFVTYVGTPTPSVVFVGDKRSCGGVYCTHKERHSTHGTAFMPYPGTSGHYLMTALKDAPRRTGLINACDVDNVVAAWRVLDYPHLVALGATAHKQLKRHGLPHAAAPHPQFIRRFHHSAVNAYGTLLNELIGTERNELKWRPSSQDEPDNTSTPTSSSVS